MCSKTHMCAFIVSQTHMCTCMCSTTLSFTTDTILPALGYASGDHSGDAPPYVRQESSPPWLIGLWFFPIVSGQQLDSKAILPSQGFIYLLRHCEWNSRKYQENPCVFELHSQRLRSGFATYPPPTALP